MSKKWAKEDRYSWEKSEVMKNFESQILSNYDFLVKNSNQMSTQKPKELVTILNNAAGAAAKLKDSLKFLNEADDVRDTQEYCEDECSYSDDEYNNSNDVKEEIINDLESMAKDAIDNKNIKLAYLIERTIAELREEDE